MGEWHIEYILCPLEVYIALVMIEISVKFLSFDKCI